MRETANDHFIGQRFRFALTEFLRALKQGGPSIEQRAALGYATREAEVLPASTYAAIIEDCLAKVGYPLASEHRRGSAPAPQREAGSASEPPPLRGWSRLKAGRR